jgi:diketogulonate reductase-like aldo/keto reductase
MLGKKIIDMSKNFKFNPRENRPFVITCEDHAVFQTETQRLYNELIMAVASKHPNETRHQTALRYIMEREEMRSISAECRRKEAEIFGKKP